MAKLLSFSEKKEMKRIKFSWFLTGQLFTLALFGLGYLLAYLFC